MPAFRGGQKCLQTRYHGANEGEVPYRLPALSRHGSNGPGLHSHMRHLFHDRSAQPTTAGRWLWQDFAAALLCVAVALAVRWHAADHSLTMDELWHLAMSTGRANDFTDWPLNELVVTPTSLTSLEAAAPPGSVWAPMRVVLHPPLYMFSLRFWREAFGGGDWMAAMYSAAWSITAILFVFASVRLQAGLGLASCIGLAMALSSLQANLGTEVRSYAMMMGLAAMAVWQMVRIEMNGATVGRAWALGLTLCPLMLTHYFAAGTCAAVCVWGLARLRGPMHWHFVASVATAAICFAGLWLPQALNQLNELGAGDAYLATDQPFWRESLLSGIAMPLRLFAYVAIRKVAMAVSLLLVAVTVAGVWRRPALLPWLVTLSMPIGMLLALDALRSTHHTFFIRYAAASAVALPAAPVLAAAALRPAAGHVLGLAFLALAAVGLGAPREIGSPAFHHMPKSFLPTISTAPSDTPIAAFMPPRKNTFYATAMLLEWSHVPGFFPRPTMLLASPQQKDLRKLHDAAPGGRFWLVTSGQPTDGANAPDWLRALLPAARLVQPPVTIPLGGGVICPQPPVELWLLELDPPP